MAPKYVEIPHYYNGRQWGLKLFIELGNPCRLGYFKKRSHSHRAGLSNDGWRNEWVSEDYKVFVPVTWDSRYDKYLPEGYKRPPQFKWPEAKPQPPKTPPPPPPPTPTHCELCEAKFTPPPRPSFKGQGQPDPKNHRRIWDPTEERILNVCLECAEEWGYGNPPSHIECDRDPKETVSLWDDEW